MRRKENLVTGELYHIFNKSIANFKIMSYRNDLLRMLNTMRYYQLKEVPLRFSDFLELADVKRVGFNANLISLSQEKTKHVKIVAYCLMPSHFHLILKQTEESGISTFVGNVLNSYARYFNTKYRRKGPLWEGKFKNIRIDNDDYLSHLTRYIHLNPVSAGIVKKPEDWLYSSYREYVDKIHEDERFCEYSDILDIQPVPYRKFAEDRIGYQKELEKIKHLIVE